MKTLCLSVTVVVIAATFAIPTAGRAADTPLTGLKLKVSDVTQPGTARRKIITVSKDAAVVIPADGSAADPSLHGGSLEIRNTAGTGESDTFPLAAGNWFRIPGDPAKPLKGWKYKQVVFNPPTDDYVIKVALKQSLSTSTLRAIVGDSRGSLIDYTLDEAMQGSIGIWLTTGADRQCLDFGGIIVADTSEDLGGGVYRGRFAAKGALAPAGCGSPSGAFVD